MFFNNKKNKKRGFTQHYLFSKKDNAGFTLLELLMVITISTIITTALVIKNREWDKTFAVRSQAYELALAIRQAQNYSLAVRGDSAGGADKFNVSYGVHIDFSVPSQYIMFVDRNLNGIYDSGESIETVTFKRSVQVTSICGNLPSGQSQCSDTPPGSNTIGKVNFTFKRPETKATVTFQHPNGNISNSLQNSYGFISLTVSPVRAYRLTVEENRVAIQKPAPPPRSR